MTATFGAADVGIDDASNNQNEYDGQCYRLRPCYVIIPGVPHRISPHEKHQSINQDLALSDYRR